MKLFTITIITASVVGGIVNSLVPDHSKLKKYVSFLVTIVCTLSLCQPIIEILTSGAKLNDAATEYFESITLQDKINVSNDIIISASKSKIESGIKELIVDKFNLDSGEISVPNCAPSFLLRVRQTSDPSTRLRSRNSRR